MKNKLSIIIMLGWIIAFGSGMLLTAAAEEEESTGEETSVELSSEISTAEESSLAGLDESSLEESSEISIEQSEDSGEQSRMEISDESSRLESMDEQSTEQSATEQSRPESIPENSRAEGSTPAPVTELSDEPSAESSRRPQETSVQSSLPEESDRLPAALRQEPLAWMSGIHTLLPGNRQDYSVSYPVSDESSLPEESVAPDNSGETPRAHTLSATAVEQNDPPDSDSGSPMRGFLIGIIIASVLGMVLTVLAIIIMRARGDFEPSFLKLGAKKQASRST